MIQLQNLTKSFTVNGTVKTVARNLNYTFPTGVSVGLLGRNGAGKSTLLKMIAGTDIPTSGRVISDGIISWPVGFSGSFHGDMTGSQNAKFVARMYGVDTDEMTHFVREFAEIGEHFFLPVRTYSSGMRSRLAFALSMAIPFDTYLIDEITAVGDAAFSARSNAILKERMKNAGAIIVSHSMSLMKTMCTAGVVLEGGELFAYPRIERAIEHHEYLQRGLTPPWLR